MKEENSREKKVISKRVHKMMNEGEYEEAEKMLLEYLEAGDRSTIILGSLINLYKCQGINWEQIETLAQEYLKLKPKNSFAKKSLELAQKIQNKKPQVDEKTRKVIEVPRQTVSDFRKKVHDGTITAQNISEEQLTGFTIFERSILLAEIYSYSNLNEKAVELLMQASQSEGITENEQRIIRQAIKLVNSYRNDTFRKRIQWNKLPIDERSELYNLKVSKERYR